jgi:hypothetical protein
MLGRPDGLPALFSAAGGSPARISLQPTSWVPELSEMVLVRSGVLAIDPKHDGDAQVERAAADLSQLARKLNATIRGVRVS